MKIPFSKLFSQRDHLVGTLLKALFFLLATSWLAAPFVHFEHLGSLESISYYEGVGQPLGWLFNLFDLLASIVLVALALQYRLHKKDQKIFWLVIAYAILASLDFFFPLDCREHVASACTDTSNLASIHFIESIAAIAVGGILILVDIIRQKRQRLVNSLFLSAQIVVGLLYLVGALTGQAAIVLQYIYEVAIALWLIYFLEAYAPAELKPPGRIYRWYRNGLAAWAALAGILEIVLAARHLHLYGHGFALYFGANSAWLAQQGVVVGVILLYLARQIQRGERRAAYALAIIFSFELFTYSLVAPHRLLAVIFELLLLITFLIRRKFDRNTGPINWLKRFGDLSAVLAGIIVAIVIIVVSLAALGKLGRAERIFDDATGLTSRAYTSSQHYFNHHDRTADTLAVLVATTAAVSVWALFRPDKLTDAAAANETAKVRHLIERHASSSEDYFKLWPTDKAYYFEDGENGFIAYKVVRGTAFALADPIASTASDRARLLSSFMEFAVKRGWSICFLGVSEASKSLYKGFKFVPYGANALVDVEKFNHSTRRDKWWRWKLNRANRAGYKYNFSSPPHSTSLLDNIEQVSDKWLASGGRREQGFALGYFDRGYMDACRIHYVTNPSGKIVAFTNEMPVFVTSQTTIDLMRFVPGDDVMPFLLASLIEQLGKEARYPKLDLGYVPLAKVTQRYLKIIKNVMELRYSAKGLEQFKNKFDPDWQPNYMAYSGDIVDLAGLALKLEAALEQPKVD